MRYGIYDSVNPDLFHRLSGTHSDEEVATPDLELSRDARSIDLDPPVLVLASELGQGGTGMVHGGYLEMRTETGTSRLEIAAKLAFDEDAKVRLVDEWRVYKLLSVQDVKGIPTMLGIFQDSAEPQIMPTCLVTTFAGKSLRSLTRTTERPELGLSGRLRYEGCITLKQR